MPKGCSPMCSRLLSCSLRFVFAEKRKKEARTPGNQQTSHLCRSQTCLICSLFSTESSFVCRRGGAFVSTSSEDQGSGHGSSYGAFKGTESKPGGFQFCFRKEGKGSISESFHSDLRFLPTARFTLISLPVSMLAT